MHGTGLCWCHISAQSVKDEVYPASFAATRQCFFLVCYWLLPRDTMLAWYMLSLCICPFVIRRCCTKTAMRELIKGNSNEFQSPSRSFTTAGLSDVICRTVVHEAVDKISTDNSSRGPCAVAELLVTARRCGSALLAMACVCLSHASILLKQLNGLNSFSAERLPLPSTYLTLCWEGIWVSQKRYFLRNFVPNTVDRHIYCQFRLTTIAIQWQRSSKHVTNKRGI